MIRLTETKTKKIVIETDADLESIQTPYETATFLYLNNEDAETLYASLGSLLMDRGLRRLIQ